MRCEQVDQLLQHTDDIGVCLRLAMGGFANSSKRATGQVLWVKVR